MKPFLKAAACVAGLALAGEARAATFLLDYDSQSGAPFAADLTVFTDDVANAAGAFDVTAISGNVDGDAITALIDNPNKPWASYSADGWFIIDNNLWPTGAPVVSNPGLFFRGASGDEYNLFSDNASTYELYRARAGVGYVENSWGALAISPVHRGSELPPGGGLGVPEPAAWTMMIVGFAGAGAMLRRRRTAAAV
jgi:hypothetical protein